MNNRDQLMLGSVLEEMSGGFSRHRPLILRITLLFAILNAASNLLNVAGPAGAALSVGILLLLSVAYGGLITALLCVPGSATGGGAGELWGLVAPLLARLIWVTLITIVAVIAGLMVLIVPGLILVTIFSVATQVVVAERTAALASLGRSVELVRGNGLRVFAFVLVLGVVCLLLIVLLGLLIIPVLGTGTAGTTLSAFLQNLIVGPILAIGPAALYNRLNPGRIADAADQAPAPPSS